MSDEPYCFADEAGGTEPEAADIGVAAVGAGPGVPDACHGTAFTGVPGGSICSFWKPSTITFSPAVNP
jgi:hypothetical protein